VPGEVLAPVQSSELVDEIVQEKALQFCAFKDVLLTSRRQSRECVICLLRSGVLGLLFWVSRLQSLGA